MTDEDGTPLFVAHLGLLTPDGLWAYRPVYGTVRPPFQSAVARCRRCDLRKRMAYLRATVPPKFGRLPPSLRRLAPLGGVAQQKQATAIAHMRRHPDESYLLVGPHGWGKSHLAYALLRHGIASGNLYASGTLKEYMEEYQWLAKFPVPTDPNYRKPRVTESDLRSGGRRWTIMIDEFDAIKVTEFSATTLFGMLNAASEWGHQVVVTSNFSLPQLMHYYGKFIPVYGTKIVSRLPKKLVSFFASEADERVRAGDPRFQKWGVA